jgi:hypothetical protein
VLSRARPLLALAAIAAVVAACDALIGLSDPSVRADAAGDGRTGADAATDVLDLDGGDTGPGRPTACLSMDACSSPGFTCVPQFNLCEPSCSPLAPCASTSECIAANMGTALGVCEGADYDCLGSVSYAPQMGPTVDVTVTLVAVATSLAPNITVRACDTSDSVCAHPRAAGTTNANGVVALQLPNAGDGFRGYFDLTAPGMAEELQYWSFPLTPGTLTVLADIDGTWNNAFQATDPSRGRLWVTAEGCSWTPAFGATLSVSGSDSETVIAMVDGFQLDEDASVFPVNSYEFVTNAPGLWAYALVNDVPVGTPTITTTYSGARVGTMQVITRPGVVTSVVLAPTP